MSTKPKKHERESACRTPRRRPYAKPTVTEHGSIEQLTQGFGLIGHDGLIGSNM